MRSKHACCLDGRHFEKRLAWPAIPLRRNVLVVAPTIQQRHWPPSFPQISLNLMAKGGRPAVGHSGVETARLNQVPYQEHGLSSVRSCIWHFAIETWCVLDGKTSTAPLAGMLQLILNDGDYHRRKSASSIQAATPPPRDGTNRHPPLGHHLLLPAGMLFCSPQGAVDTFRRDTKLACWFVHAIAGSACGTHARR